MDPTRADPLSIQRNVILGLLLALAAAAWALLVWQGTGADTGMAMASPTMGMRAPLFLTIWVVMMVAMMFPTAAPMILTFHKVQSSKRQRGEVFVATWVFVAAYLVVWALSGVAAYAGARAAEAIAAHAALSPATAARIGGAVLVAAGLTS
jgi:predicted metal-binding membrane protein